MMFPVKPTQASGSHLQARMVFLLFLIITLVSITACKNDKSTGVLEQERMRADSIMQAAARNKQRLETDDELAERIRRLKNKAFTANDSVYYNASVSARPDSLISIIRLEGKTNRSGSINTFDHEAVTLEGKVAKGVMSGRYFRMDQTKSDKKRLYSIEPARGKIHAYLLEVSANSLSLEPTEPTGNFLFDLLSKKQFGYDLHNEERFFKTIKAARITDNPDLDSVFGKAEIYRDNKHLLPEWSEQPFSRLWVRSEKDCRNILLTRPTDTTWSYITLGGKHKSNHSESLISSKFLNDSTWIQSRVTDSLVYDHPHLVVYMKDSIIREYRYDKKFNFRLTKTDTIRTKENYPQRYPELNDSVFEIKTQAFRMNGHQAYWRYLVNYTGKNSERRDDAPLRVTYKDLVDASKDELIFRLPRAGTPLMAGLPELLHPDTLFGGVDLNFDGWADLSFQKGTDNNNNPVFISYLYDKGNGRFKRTPELDGTSVFSGIVRDTINQKLLYTGYIDNGHMSVSIISPIPGADKTREIFWTTGDKKAPQVHYQKLINNSIVDKRSPLLDSLHLTDSDLKSALIGWILNRK